MSFNCTSNDNYSIYGIIIINFHIFFLKKKIQICRTRLELSIFICSSLVYHQLFKYHLIF